jgi:hypothetical protein
MQNTESRNKHNYFHAALRIFDLLMFIWKVLEIIHALQA